MSNLAYDALNRLNSLSYVGAPENDVSYSYDTEQIVCGLGESFSTDRLVAILDASGSTQYCYDVFGRIVRKVQVTNGLTFTVSYSYTKSGQLKALTYPDGSVADYVRDVQGRVMEVGITSRNGGREIVLSNVSYAPFGPATGWIYGNGRALNRTFDLNYRPVSILDHAVGGLDLGFSYDAVANITALRTADLAEPARAKFGYDSLYRLTAFKDGATDTAIESYSYDATGNRVNSSNQSGSQTYVYQTGSHRLISVAGMGRVYDEAGNTTAIGGTVEYVYDAASRLSEVKRDGAISMHYIYNGKGERVRRHISGTDVTTLYDEAGSWLGDYGSDGLPLQQAILLDGLPVGVLVGDTKNNLLYYVETDHLGSPRVVIDPLRNTPVWSWDLTSEAFGASLQNQDPDGDGVNFIFDMRFPGQRYDAASSLNYNYFRDYEPATGRYSQSDPIGLAGGLSTYAYVGGNPVNAIDPLGLRALTNCETNFLGNYFPADVLSQIDVTTGFSLKPNLGANIWNFTPKGNVYAQTYKNDIYVGTDVPNGIDPSARATYGVGLLGHEITHSVQFQTFGVAGFYAAYLSDYATNGQGYSGISFERSAAKIEQAIQQDLQKNGLGCGCGP